MEYRELSEKEKLRLESELLEQQIRRSHLDILKDEIQLMRGLRVDEKALRQIAWQRLGVSLTALGQHQDRRLIAGPVPEDHGHHADGDETSKWFRIYRSLG